LAAQLFPDRGALLRCGSTQESPIWSQHALCINAQSKD